MTAPRPPAQTPPPIPGAEPPVLPPVLPVVLTEPRGAAPVARPADAPDAPLPVPEGWQGIMRPGEQIVWRGQPIARPKVVKVVLGAGFGLLFAGFALVWMVMAAQAGGFFWAFGLLHFAVGMGFAAKAVMDERMRLRDTFFTLSTRAAYIARRHWLRGRQLETYPITPDMTLALGGDAAEGDVIFASRALRTKNGTQMVPIGFLDIQGAPEVFAHLTRLRDQLRDTSA